MNRHTTVGESRYKGVTRNGAGNWQARLMKDGQSYCAGTFKSEEEAALAYDGLALGHFGEFAQTNTPKTLLTAVRRLCEAARMVLHEDIHEEHSYGALDAALADPALADPALAGLLP